MIFARLRPARDLRAALRLAPKAAGLSVLLALARQLRTPHRLPPTKCRCSASPPARPCPHRCSRALPRWPVRRSPRAASLLAGSAVFLLTLLPVSFPVPAATTPTLFTPSSPSPSRASPPRPSPLASPTRSPAPDHHSRPSSPGHASDDPYPTETTPVRHSSHAAESYESFNDRYASFFASAQDLFELQRGLNNCFAYDLVPSQKGTSHRHRSRLGAAGARRAAVARTRRASSGPGIARQAAAGPCALRSAWERQSDLGRG